MHVLLLEDHQSVAEGIMTGLRLHGINVTHASDAASADLILRSTHVDICVLDLNLPDEDGLSFLARCRARGEHLPVLILSARDAPPHRVAGLTAGADDYVVKPFDFDELIARLQALMRRVAGSSTNVLRWGALSLEIDSQRAMLGSRQLAMSRREFALLRCFLQYPTQILSIEQLQDVLYGLDQLVESNAVNVHIHHLRRKIGPSTIETIRGVGYRLGTPPDQDCQ